MVLLIPEVHLDLPISQNFHQKFEMALMLFSVAWGKMIHWKKDKAENLMTLLL
jgi:hypothetical protein